MPERDAMADRVASIVGTERVRTGEAAARWAVHGLAPRVVAAPPSDEAAAELLALASAEGWAVEVAGSGGCLDAGHVPGRVDLVVTTEALVGVESHEPADLVATVRAGTTLSALASALAPHRQWLPLDPPDRGDATVGGVVAQASAGPLREGHGTPRDHVLGLRLVTGDGRVLDLGGRVVKNVAGYDLVRLATGSRGTLGLITRLHLRLRPLPERDETLAWHAAEPGPLVDLAAWIREERIGAAAVELVGGVAAGVGGVRADGPGAGGLGAAVLSGAGDGAWTLLVRLQGNAEAVEAMRARLAEVVTAEAPVRITDGASRGRPDAAPTPGSAAAVWPAHSVLEARAGLCIRLADLPSRLPETLDAARELAGKLPGAAVLAHAGAGIVRVCAGGARGEESGATKAWSAPDLDRLAEHVSVKREQLAAQGGTVVVARGPRELAERIDPWHPPTDTALRLMRGLGTVFDPAGVLARDGWTRTSDWRSRTPGMLGPRCRTLDTATGSDEPSSMTAHRRRRHRPTSSGGHP